MPALSLPSVRRTMPALIAAATLSLGAAASAQAAPQITGISPTSGPVGTTITFTGTELTGLQQIQMVGDVDGRGEIVRPTSVTDTEVQVVAPTRPAGSVHFKLYLNSTLIESTADLKFTYVGDLPAPTISTVSPASGPIEGGNAVFIEGNNLLGTTAVLYGGVPSTNVQGVTNTQLIAFPPPQAAGTVDVTIKTAGGEVTKVGAYTYVGAVPPLQPAVTRVSGAAFAGIGGIVQISGTNLRGVRSVKIGTKSAPFTAIGTNTLLVLAPAQSKGTYAVSVTTANGTSPASSAARLTYLGF